MAPIQSDDYSLLHVERISQYVSLSPASLASPLPALCASIFSPLLLSYFPPARGVVLAYEDIELSDEAPEGTTTTKSSLSQKKSKKARYEEESSSSEDSDEDSEEDNGPGKQLLLRHVDEYSAPFLWATASFLVWRPEAQAHISGRVTHQSSTHITLSHLNTFPVSVLSTQLPDEWEWHAAEQNKKKKGWDGRIADEGGWWVDGEGNKIGDEGELRVRIRGFDGRMDGRGRGKGFLRIEGSLVSEEEEARREVTANGKKGKQRQNGSARRMQAGASNEEAMEID